MTRAPGNRPAEIFGYPPANRTNAAQEVRRRHWCPFMENACDKKSRLLDIPFGVCTVEHGGGIRAICPHRFPTPFRGTRRCRGRAAGAGKHRQALFRRPQQHRHLSRNDHPPE